MTRDVLARELHILTTIGGIPFAATIEDRDPTDVVKTILRRRYKPVYDPRTALKPLTVAKGEPVSLVVGGEIIPFHQCKQIAQEIAARG